jgi:hypothetical protein
MEPDIVLLMQMQKMHDTRAQRELAFTGHRSLFSKRTALA